jgi:hypothetical protein
MSQKAAKIRYLMNIATEVICYVVDWVDYFTELFAFWSVIWPFLLVLLVVGTLAGLVQVYRIYKFYKSLTIANYVDWVDEAKDKKKGKKSKLV